MAKTVLVADDEADVRAYLSAVLEKAGFVVVTAADGRQALAAVEDSKPDLIILDLQMPDQTGTDFYRHMMRQEALRDTPVIVVSGLAGRHLAVSRPFAVFDKPIDPDEFVATVRRALRMTDD